MYLHICVCDESTITALKFNFQFYCVYIIGIIIIMCSFILMIHVLEMNGSKLLCKTKMKKHSIRLLISMSVATVRFR